MKIKLLYDMALPVFVEDENKELDLVIFAGQEMDWTVGKGISFIGDFDPPAEVKRLRLEKMGYKEDNINRAFARCRTIYKRGTRKTCQDFWWNAK